MLRLFIALELSGSQKSEVMELQQSAKCYLPEVRWVRREGLHLTLKFLGDCEETKLEAIREAMERAADNIEPFDLKYGGCSVFPDPQKARVLWVGLKEGAESVKALAYELEENLEKIGFEKEKRPYHPHLTVGRTRNRQPKDLINKYIAGRKDFAGTAHKVQEVVLFRSRLSPQGAEYSALYRIAL